MCKKTVMTLLLTALSFVGFAQNNVVQNEDLQFIRNWEKAQHATAVAEALALTAAQVETLKGIRVQVDEVKARFDDRFATFDDTLAATAAEVRARIEATNNFSDEDKALLKNLKKERRELGKEKHLNIQLATIGLDELLTEDQLETLRNMVKEQHGNAGGRRGKPDAGNSANKERRVQREGNNGKLKIARLLLSDAFLAYYE